MLPKSFTLTPSNAAFAALLRGEQPSVAWSSPLIAEATATLISGRLGPLVHAAGVPASWPAAIRDCARAEARAAAVVEVAQRRELDRVTRCLATASIGFAVFKGGALAYTVYDDPALRPREDLDILIALGDVPRAAEALRSEGYVEVEESGGSVATHQRHFVRHEGGALRHACDVHWRVTNPHAFAAAVDTVALIRRAVPLAAAGPAVRVLTGSDALFVAAIHRVAHHDGSDLLWVFDVARLLATLRAPEIDAALRMAEASQVRAVVADALLGAARWFAAPLSADVTAWCNRSRDAAEPTAAFLSGELRAADVLVSDLRAIPDWTTRLQLVRERLFPPAAYMRARSGTDSARTPLPILYLRRLWRGVPRWLER